MIVFLFSARGLFGRQAQVFGQRVEDWCFLFFVWGGGGCFGV